jgi:hypothetical protein
MEEHFDSVSGEENYERPEFPCGINWSMRPTLPSCICIGSGSQTWLNLNPQAIR